jgi:hypothetical protein
MDLPQRFLTQIGNQSVRPEPFECSTTGTRSGCRVVFSTVDMT